MRYEIRTILQYLWRNKFTSLVCVAFLGFATLFSALSLEYFLRAGSGQGPLKYSQPVSEFAVTNVKLLSEAKGAGKLFRGLTALLGDDTVTWHYSNSFSERYRTNTILVIGERNLLQNEPVGRGAIEVYSDAAISEMMIRETVYPVVRRDVSVYKQWASGQGGLVVQDEPLIVIYAPVFPKEWLDTDNPNAVFSFFSHMVIAESNVEKREAFLKLEQGSFLAIRPKKAQEYRSDVTFIAGFNLLFILICLTVFFLCVYMILAGMIARAQKRLIIEYFFGAGIFRLCSRFGVAFALLLMPGYGLYLCLAKLMRFSYVSDAMILGGFVVLWLLYVFQTWWLLKRADLHISLKGV